MSKLTYVSPVLVRSQRATGIGRLMVNIVEGIELKPCRSHGTKTLGVHTIRTVKEFGDCNFEYFYKQMFNFDTFLQ